MADEVRALVLVGVTGDGKSSTGNTLSAGSSFEVSAGLSSATQTCSHADYMLMQPLPAFYRVVDTLGLHDTGLPAAEVMARFSAFAAHTPFGIDAFVFVVRFGRFKPEHEAAFGSFVANCGEGALKHTVLVFTCCSSGEAELHAAVDATAPPALRAILPRLGGGVVGVENMQDSAAGRRAVHAAVATMIERNQGERYSNEALAEARGRHDAKEEAERAAFAAAVSDWRKGGSGPVKVVRE
ncbi:AIG1-type guanine nucleotide-binding (G) domain-containing protein [Pavlovales sp. CCMP2436]|nr:AIG1-type guanine nucleotide-binding (G) domain-containing protein [Pavlovales sp. CCMP2436]